jgi:FkbM family methyltransferase
MQLRRRLGFDWLSERIAPFVNISGRVPLTVTTRDELTIVSDGTAEFAVLSPDFLRAFRHGIAKRLDRLARVYGIDRYVPIRPGDVVVNCGANVGALTLALVRRGARVIAVEPDPTTLKALRLNVGNLDRVEVVPVGLWKTDGELTFYQAPLTSDTSAINQDGPPVTIMANRLDTLLRARGIERLRLLVGDAEGAEPEVLEGASGILERTDYFAMECGYERRGERTLERCTALLTATGFKVVHVTKANRLIAKNTR